MASELESIRIEDITRIFSGISFENLDIQLYTRPVNIFEVFDAITWTANKDMSISLELINAGRKKDIDIFSLLYSFEKMIERNNGKTPVQSFSLTFIPMFYDF